MRSYLLKGIGCFLFFLLFSSPALGRIKQNEDIKARIRVLNLLNGLYLEQEQSRLILKKAYEFQSLKEKLQQKLKKYETSEREILSQVEESLKKDFSVDDYLAKEYHRLETTLKDIKRDYEERMESLAHQVEDILMENQLYLIQSYKPCIIPPKGTARIGQVEEPLGIQKKIEFIRRLPSMRYSLEKESIAERMIQRAKDHLPWGLEYDEDKKKKEVLALLDEMRSLSDLDFDLKKKDYTQKLKDILIPKPRPRELYAKIASFLFSPEAISLLEERLKSSSER